MDNVIKYFNDIESSFHKMRNITVVCLVASCSFAAAACFLAFDFASKAADRVFILDRGTALMATAARGEAQRDLEAEDHVARFHDFLFNLSPNKDAISRNVDRALAMADESAYNYWRDLSERGFYQRLVSANISQQIVIDSVRADIRVYPYEAVTYGKLFLMRESNITSYLFESSCRLVDAERSETNPHGLMIEKFTVRRNENIGTKRRK